MAISRRIAAVAGLSEPHSAVLNGVKNSAPTVENAVIVTESAVLPRAKWVRKFEMLPPGQHATRINAERDARLRAAAPS